MSATTKVWSNNNPPSCEDDDLNGFKNENNNLILGSGQALSTVDNQQTHKAVADYAASGAFYTDSGIADAYVLDVIGAHVAPPAYRDGMVVEFLAGNSNAGASTVNVAGLGVKNIVGTGIAVTIIEGVRYKLIYRDSSGDFEILQIAIAKVPLGHISGLTLSNAADADHDITIAIGEAANSSGAAALILAASITKQIDAAWAAGDAAGGLFTGVVAINTWYHVFLIRKDSDGTIDAGFDTSITAANIPAGYTAYRRIGSVLTDGSSNILNFTQFGDQFTWKDYQKDSTVVFNATGFDVTLSTPVGVRCEAKISVNVVANNTSDNKAHILSPDMNAPTLTDDTANVGSGTGNSVDDPRGRGQIDVWTGLTSQVQTKANQTMSISIVSTLGYKDLRGQN